ncbi:glycosyltransferase [Flavobacterium sp.]|uniref:glycosyltransferase n=1 Tax=Flavobacterium sp. TaxID=239 RepID=UPI00260AFA0B|nr:glycosyltransferase [Flavobacterium sp.]
MKLLVISSAPFIKKDNDYFAYGPYAKELVIWAKYADEIAFTCPIWKQDNGLLISKISFPLTKIYEVKDFNVKTVKNTLQALLYSFFNCYLIFKSMLWADHIHLRCPGNIGLMGCMLQIFFPHKTKTAKYAGNWDLKAKQPISYRVQKWILRNTFLTKNMQVLVYGEWENSTKRIKPFFTASYYASEIHPVPDRWDRRPWHVVFVGTLGANKRPMYVVQLVAKIRQQGIPITLALYGHGAEQARITQFIQEQHLSEWIVLHGNQPREVIQQALCEAHFVCLPSQSEGWPKAVAEGMFWGAIPWATSVSCVPQMLDEGRRGLLLTLDMDRDCARIQQLCNDSNALRQQAQQAMEWSRQYTLDAFELAIRKLMQP